MRHAELAGQSLRALEFQVDADDDVRAGQPRALNNVEADAAQSEDCDGRPWRHLGRIQYRADSGGDAAADIGKPCRTARPDRDLRHGDLRQHGEVGEGRGAHVMQHLLALIGKTRGAVRHQALALGGADRLAEIGFARQTEFALTAFRGVQRDDEIAGLDRGDAGADIAHDTRALMAQDRGKQALRIGARQGEGIGMADACRLDLDQHLTGLGPFQIDRLDDERLAGFKRNCGSCLHVHPPRCCTAQ